jgi:hypothetical protein
MMIREKRVIEITSIDILEKVRLLSKLRKAGVPSSAVIARCHVEGIDPDWIVNDDIEFRLVVAPKVMWNFDNHLHP